MHGTSLERIRSVVVMATALLIVTNLMDASVEAKGPPKIGSNYQMRHLARVGDSVRLVCPVDSSTPPLITWQKDSETIHLGWDRFRINEHDRVLKIKELELTDAGVYFCKATNGFGSAEAKYLLYVGAANDTSTPPPDFDENIFENLPGRETQPKFIKYTDMDPFISVQTGSTASLTCKSSGRPKPEVTWYKENDALSSDTMESLAGGEVNESWMLRLVAVTSKDAGRYTCRVFNTVGYINFTYTLQVADSSSSDRSPDFIAPHPENVTVRYGGTAYFNCHVRSSTVPLVQWLKPLPSEHHRRINNTVTLNNKLYAVMQGGLLTSHKDGTYTNRLTISPVNDHDMGMYICSMTNSHGLVFRSAYLSIMSEDVVRENEETAEDSDALFGLISGGSYLPIGVVVAVSVAVIIIVVVVVVAVFCRRRSENEKAALQQRQSNSLVSAPSSAAGAGSYQVQSPTDYAAMQHQQQQMRLLQQQQQPMLNNGQAPLRSAGSRERIAWCPAAQDVYSDYSSISRPMSTPMHQGPAPGSSQKQLIIHGGTPQQQQLQQQQQIQQPFQPTQLRYYEDC